MLASGGNLNEEAGRAGKFWASLEFPRPWISAPIGQNPDVGLVLRSRRGAQGVEGGRQPASQEWVRSWLRRRREPPEEASTRSEAQRLQGGFPGSKLGQPSGRASVPWKFLPLRTEEPVSHQGAAASNCDAAGALGKGRGLAFSWESPSFPHVVPCTFHLTLAYCVQIVRAQG